MIPGMRVVLTALALVVGYPKLIADSSICRAHAPVGTSAKSATLAVNYLDGEGRRKVLRKFAAVVEPCRGECYYSVASSVF